MGGMVGSVLLLTCAFSTAQAQVTYDFSGAHTGHNAYEGTIPSSPLPPTSRTIPSTELNSTDYSEIASSNNVADNTSNSSSSNRAAQRYVFTLAQTGSSLLDMTVLWEGQTTSGGTVRLYVWNNSTSSYTLVASTSNSSSDATLTAVYTAPSQYVDSSNRVTLLALNTADAESLRTDYVRVTVRQCASSGDCSDGNACTTNSCNSGLCVFTNNTNACTDDGNPCTNDVCAGGVCAHPNKANGSACSDGNACTQTDTCQSGTCTGSNPVVCAALDSCHSAGTCAPVTGICSNPAKPNGTACSDGLFCNGEETCTNGTCHAPSPPNCDDGVPCTTDSCNESTHSCVHVPSDAACSDGLNCNGQETCNATLGCQPGASVNCNDGVACTIDTCHETRNRFVSTAVSHVSGATHVTSTSNPVAGDFTAMLWARIDIDRNAPSTFFFIGGSIADPRYFKSFYAGTGGDAAGRTTWIQALTPGTPIDPANSDILELGAWHHIAMVGNASSNGAIKLYLDGMLRQSGIAPAGTYVGELIEILNVPLNNGNDRMIGSFAAWKRYAVQLTQAQIQAEMPFARAVKRTNLVQEVTFLNNTDIHDRSGNGNHFVVTGPALDDAQVGPDIQDELSQGCEHTPSNAACDDGLWCNGVEICYEALGCQPGTPPNCNDGVACTADSCNEATNSCDHVATDRACDDGSFCNGAETCDPTLGCQPGIPPNCADDIACTDDGCENNTCVHIPNNRNCPDDELFCTGAEVCDPIEGCLSAGDPCPTSQHCNESTHTCGECSIDSHCDDGVGCTDDKCVLGGCVYTVDHAHCADDGLYCNGSEYCDPVLDCHSTGNPCAAELSCREIDDSCVECLGDSDCDEETPFCMVIPGDCVKCLSDADCDEGKSCIVGHSCIQGTCHAGSSVNCSAFNSDCTTASCDAAGPEGNCDIDTPVADETPCSDGNACTLNDVCTNGSCVAGASVVCTPAGQCKVGQCNPETGACSFSPAENGTTCNDGNNCTIYDACYEGACRGDEVYALLQWSKMSDCLTGPDTGVSQDCDCSNLEPNEPVDLKDVAEFMLRFTEQPLKHQFSGSWPPADAGDTSRSLSAQSP